MAAQFPHLETSGAPVSGFDPFMPTQSTWTRRTLLQPHTLGALDLDDMGIMNNDFHHTVTERTYVLLHQVQPLRLIVGFCLQFFIGFTHLEMATY
jgi:hypothetical protein